MSPAQSMHTNRPILFSCAGRRNELLDRFRASMERMLQAGEIAHVAELLAFDADGDAPAFRAADQIQETCTIDKWSDKWLREVLDSWKPAAIIPLIDHELKFWAARKERIANRGTTVWVSGEETLDICLDKQRAKEFLQSIDISVPEFVTSAEDGDGSDDTSQSGSGTGDSRGAGIEDEAEAGGETKLGRWLAKPRYGHSSRGIFPDAFMKAHPSIYRQQWLDHFLGRDDYIVEQAIDGPEISVDVLARRDGSVPCVVPRYRTKTVGGEVVQSETFYDAGLEEEVRRIVRALPDPFGPMNIQCILDPQGRYRFTEINPRFGGGVTLSIASGADIPGWMVAHDLGVPFGEKRLRWEPGCRMSRYPEGIYLHPDPATVAGTNTENNTGTDTGSQSTSR